MTEKKEREGFFGETARTVFYAVIIALVFRSFLFQPFSIPSESMLPNLQTGDYLLVSKYSYGYSHHSLPLSPKLFSGRIMGSPVERGDVVVFRLPRDPGVYYIKRIIGLPGDTVQMKGGRLYLNGTAVKREKVENYVLPDEQGNQRNFEQYRETLPNGKQYMTLDMGYRPSDNTKIFHVPAGTYFALGDNRDNSIDSRWPSSVGVGLVPDENVIGLAEFITFSVDSHSQWWEVWNWFSAARFDRFFNTIH
ncbi:MAG: signal peptidase I [Kordiimonas sp.]|nr:signal peptidase I [Kordiimonas sp.]